MSFRTHLLFLLSLCPVSPLWSQDVVIRKIELLPTQAASSNAAFFTRKPSVEPSRFFGENLDTGTRAVDFNTAPDGALAEGGSVNTQYESLGVVANGVRVSATVSGGNDYGQGFGASDNTPQIYTFDPPVIATGIINTSPGNDLIEFFSGPDASGELLLSFRDQEGVTPNGDIDRFVGAIAGGTTRIGSIRLSNNGGILELDELIFAAADDPCLDPDDLPEGATQSVVRVTVPGNADPFLAGQPDGVGTKGDSAPDESPVLATPVIGGEVLTFSAIGASSHVGSRPAGGNPDGGGFTSSSSALGIAGYTGAGSLPINCLVGVFLSDLVPVNPAPDVLTYPDGLAFTSLSPGLQQIFFVGDGLSGTGQGERQQFIVPQGATRLIMGTTDGFGWYNNSGIYDVAICRTQNIAFGPQLGPTDIFFDQDEYTIDFGDDLNGTIKINPIPLGGMYSHGLNITLRSRDGTLAGVITPVAVNSLDNDGPLLGEKAAIFAEAGTGAVKGSALFSASLETNITPNLATFTASSLPPGLYDLSISPWNELGATEDIFVTGLCLTLDDYITFRPATLEVVGSILPQLDLTGPIALNRQTGLLEQELTIGNPSTIDSLPFRLFVEGLPDDVVLWNAQGEVDGVPYIDFLSLIAAGGTSAAVLEYYRPNRQANFTPTFRLQGLDDPEPPGGGGQVLALDLRVFPRGQGQNVVEFLSESDASYLVEYSDDMTTWSVSLPAISGTGERIQWIDQGPPKTSSAPFNSRFYRITLAPAQP